VRQWRRRSEVLAQRTTVVVIVVMDVLTLKGQRQSQPKPA
jgi:hypothetical protein